MLPSLVSPDCREIRPESPRLLRPVVQESEASILAQPSDLLCSPEASHPSEPWCPCAQDGDRNSLDTEMRALGNGRLVLSEVPEMRLLLEMILGLEG